MFITAGQISDCLHWSSFGISVIDHFTQYKSYRTVRLLPKDLNLLDPQYVYAGYASRLSELEDCERASDCLFLLCRCQDIASSQIERTPIQAIFTPVDEPATLMEEVCAMQTSLSEWDTAIADAYLQGASLQELLDLSQDVLKNPLLLLDSSMRVLAYSKNIADDDDYFLRAVALGYTPPEVMDLITHKDYSQYTQQPGTNILLRGADSISPYPVVFHFTTIKNEFCGGLIMHCSATEETPGLIDSLNHFIDRITTYFGNDFGKGINPRNANFLYEHYFRHLLDGREMDDTTAQSINNALNTPFEASFRLFILTNLGSISSGYTLSRVLEAMPDAKCIFYEGSIVGITAFQSKYRSEDEYAEALWQTLAYLTDTLSCQCGISRPFLNQMELRIAYHQAKAAVEVGNRIISCKNPNSSFHLGYIKKSTLFFYDELFLHHTALCTSADIPLEQMCMPELLDMIEYDKKNCTDNYRVLYAYLRASRKSTETAQMLHMHRNNVIYRIKRISSLFGLNLEDAQTCLKIQYSFCVLDLL